MAHFKTAWLQKEQVLDVKVATNCKVGDMVVLNPDGETLDLTRSLASADYIIAQSDMTMEYGHIPVEQHDHRYSDKVASSTTKKKVAVFFILDKSDIVLDADETK